VKKRLGCQSSKPAKLSKIKVATSCRRCRRRSIRLKVYLPTRGKCNLVHLVKETILYLDVTWMTTVQPSLVPHNISARVHAPADIHDKGDSLGMLLPAKGKAFWLATAHIDGFAASDTILKRQVLQEAGKIVEMHHPQFELKIFLVIVQIEGFFIQSFLFIAPRDDQSILVQLPCGLVLQPLTFSFTSFLALQANLPMRRAKGRRDSTVMTRALQRLHFLYLGCYCIAQGGICFTFLQGHPHLSQPAGTA